jgi:hypothetical protein
VRWPAKVKPQTVTTALAHIDVTPTLLAAAEVKADAQFDGKSFLGLLQGDTGWHDRTLFVQWHRGDEPEKYRAFAARGPQYKLVQANGVQPNAKWQPKYELFDIAADPFEEKDLAAAKPEEVAKLKKQYEDWFADVTKKGFAPPRIVIGSEKENPVRLSRQDRREDWNGEKEGWSENSYGHWEVKFEREGNYRVTVYSPGEFDSCDVYGCGVAYRHKFAETQKGKGTFELSFFSREGNLYSYVSRDKKDRGAMHVELEYLGPKNKK